MGPFMIFCRNPSRTSAVLFFHGRDIVKAFRPKKEPCRSPSYAFDQPDGIVEFKTDNTDLFDFSLEEIEPAGWKLLAMTRDLHKDPDMREGNIMTEYETKFSALGQKICKYVIAR